MEITIRNAEISDSESIAELSGQLGYISNNSVTQNRLIEILENKNNCVFVAVSNKTIVGWIHGFYTLRVESDPFIEIGGLVVHENYQKNGIGKTLVEYVIRWSASKYCCKTRVRCNLTRKESHKFYENIGFKENKIQKVFDKEYN